MNVLHNKTIYASTRASPSFAGDAVHRPSASDSPVRGRRAAQTALRSENWERRFGHWSYLAVAARRGESQTYGRLLRELDVNGTSAHRNPCGGGMKGQTTAKKLASVVPAATVVIPRRPSAGPWPYPHQMTFKKVADASFADGVRKDFRLVAWLSLRSTSW